MKQRRFILLSALISIMMTGCSNPTSHTDPADLIGPVWRLQVVEIIDGAVYVVTDETYTLQFSADSTVSGSIGCNTYHATTLISSDNLIYFTQISETLGLCAGPSEYYQYFNLGLPYLYEIRADKLRLINVENGYVLVFSEGEH